MRKLLIPLLAALALPTAVDANIIEQYKERNNNKCSVNNAQFKASAYLKMGFVYAVDDDNYINRYCITYDNRIILYRKAVKQGYRDYHDRYQEGRFGYQTSEYGTNIFGGGGYTIISWVEENNKLYRYACWSDQSDECSEDIEKKLMGERIVRGSSSTLKGSSSTLNGFHTYAYESGIYRGNWINGKKNGKGTYKWKNGDMYVGDWLNDKKNGKGTFTWNNGDKYVGDWLDDKHSGNGTFTWENGDKYVGEFVNDKFTGKGTFTWKKSGNTYKGDWLNDKKNGKGTFTWNNGDKYVGDYVNNRRNGYGELTWENGDKYVGEFVNGNLSGKGTFFFSNGDKYVGEFINNKRTGYGEFTNKRGKIKKGQWLNDELIKKY